MNPAPAASRLLHRLAPVAVIAALAGIVYVQHGRQAETGALPRAACPDPYAGCALSLAGRPVSLGLTGSPRAMHPFGIWVRAAHARRVRAAFTMADMDMGLNLYTLKSDSGGVFRAEVTLPVCVTGRSDWLMTLDIDGDKMVVPLVIGM